METTVMIAADKLRKEILRSEINIKIDLRERYLKEVNKKFNVPTGDVMDYISGRSKIEQATPFMLYILSYGFDNTCGTNFVKAFFTDAEIREYGNGKVKDNSIKFPILIPCLKVTDDQWIGACDVDFIMQLRNAQIINYNVNAQRAMQKVIRHGVTSYKIFINKNALKKIKESLEDGAFIPNTITLNIPEDEVDFEYDNTHALLKINRIKHMDIADGYHRYLAMCQIKDENPNFDYAMELRIVHFPDSKVKQFIYQEDQKTKMRKIDSDSMNVSAPENLVTERINRDPMFFYSGGISHGNGVIDYSEFAACVKYFYFKSRIPKKDIPRAVNNVKESLMNALNSAFPFDGIDRFNFKQLLIIFTCINLGCNKEVMQRCLQNEDKFTVVGRGLRKGIVTKVEEAIRSYV